ncbi:MAG: hypothetical protein ACRC6N_04615 [Plesiomonas sp.]|uniref:hypothetical protein n=1 Tax=Plesiomonas sp. TaxID=2486279 RepID=UPI003F3A6501
MEWMFASWAQLPPSHLVHGNALFGDVLTEFGGFFCLEVEVALSKTFKDIGNMALVIVRVQRINHL